MLSSAVLFFVSHRAEDKYFAISTFITSAVAVYGRIVAKEKLVIKEKKEKKDAKSTN